MGQNDLKTALCTGAFAAACAVAGPGTTFAATGPIDPHEAAARGDVGSLPPDIARQVQEFQRGRPAGTDPRVSTYQDCLAQPAAPGMTDREKRRACLQGDRAMDAQNPEKFKNQVRDGRKPATTQQDVGAAAGGAYGQIGAYLDQMGTAACPTAQQLFGQMIGLTGETAEAKAAREKIRNTCGPN